MGKRRVPTHSRAVGRPLRLLDDNVRKVLIEALRAGAPVGLACEAASMSRSTFHSWMQRGFDAHEIAAQGGETDPSDEPYRVLYEEVQSARATAGVRNVGIIQRVAQGGTVLEKTTEKDPDGTERVIEKRQAPDWRAAAWYLEKVRKDEFRKDAEQVEVTGAGGGPVQVTADAEDLAARLAEHLAAGAVTAPLAIESTREDAPDEPWEVD